jgi:excinuclease ABC subunit A
MRGQNGIGRVYEVTEKTMVPDDSLTIRERAIAAWPPAWHGQNLRDILLTLGYDVDTPRRDLPKKDRDWILFTDEQPTVPVYAGFTPAETRRALRRKMEPSYMGAFTGARKYVLHTFATTHSALMKKRVARYMVGGLCPVCHGKRLGPAALSVEFAGYDISEMAQMPLAKLAGVLLGMTVREAGAFFSNEPSVLRSLQLLQDIGLGYLRLGQPATELSGGEAQRIKLATELQRSQHGDTLYVLDEPTTGLHAADVDKLMKQLNALADAGNTVVVVEHDMRVVAASDWVIDMGPGAGDQGGRIVASGTPGEIAQNSTSRTAPYLGAITY